MLKTLFGGIVTGGTALLGVSSIKAEPTSATKDNKGNKYILGKEEAPNEQPPLFSAATTHGDLVFLSGIGYHEEGDITKATNEVLKQMEKRLEDAGSSMKQVMKANVYLADLADYKTMNKAYYNGRWGGSPPARTTVATYGGVPGHSLVEIDCIATKT
jgi:enamine deaminase RidA (YjgF/YER057c/UK114 family)